jgi:hypothetical protein
LCVCELRKSKKKRYVGHGTLEFPTYYITLTHQLVTIATVTSLAKNQTRSEKSVTINQPLDHLDGTSHGARARLNNTTRTRQHGVSLVEEFVHFSCGLSALGYGPNDQRLTAAAICKQL